MESSQICFHPFHFNDFLSPVHRFPVWFVIFCLKIYRAGAIFSQQNLDCFLKKNMHLKLHHTFRCQTFKINSNKTSPIIIISVVAFIFQNKGPFFNYFWKKLHHRQNLILRYSFDPYIYTCIFNKDTVHFHACTTYSISI